MGKSRPPKLDALVVCRAIGTDSEQTRWDLQGVIRGRLEADRFPFRLPGLGVYLALTGMQGSYQIAVEIVSLATGKMLRTARTTGPVQVDDPLAPVTHCIPLQSVEFADRGRYACRLLANGDLVHETVFEVDWPRPEHVRGTMSPESFARGFRKLRERNPEADDAFIARLCGVEPDVVARMAVSYEGLAPELMGEVIGRLCVHYRMRPEEFLEEFP